MLRRNFMKLGVTCLLSLCLTPSFGLRQARTRTRTYHLGDVKRGEPDFSAAASGIFSSYRIPAALLAGAAYGGTFSTPLNMNDNLSKQLSKRSFVVVGLATVCAELLAVVVSTCAIDKIAVGDKMLLSSPNSSSLREYLDMNFELEWVSLRVNFILGLLGFAVMCGLRAWCFLSCPVFSRVSIGIITTAIFLMVALMTEALTTSRDLVHLCQRYAFLIWVRCAGRPNNNVNDFEVAEAHRKLSSTNAGGTGRSSNVTVSLKGRILFVAAAVVGVITMLYTAWAYTHVIEYFFFNGLPWEEKVKKGWTKALHFGGGKNIPWNPHTSAVARGPKSV
jgi:hypothetical protein